MNHQISRQQSSATSRKQNKSADCDFVVVHCLPACRRHFLFAILLPFIVSPFCCFVMLLLAILLLACRLLPAILPFANLPILVGCHCCQLGGIAAIAAIVAIERRCGRIGNGLAKWSWIAFLGLGGYVYIPLAAKMQWRGISFFPVRFYGSILGSACLEHGPNLPIPFPTRGWAMLVAVGAPSFFCRGAGWGPLCFGIVGASSLRSRGPDANCGRENPMYPFGGCMGKNPNPSNPHRIGCQLFLSASRIGEALYAEGPRWSKSQSFFCWLLEMLHPLYPSPRPPAWRVRAICEDA